MTSALDEISFKLGELSAGQAMLLARADKQEALLSDISKKLAPMVDDVADMKPHVEHYKGARKRAAWVNSLVVGIASICGSAVTAYTLKKLGG